MQHRPDVLTVEQLALELGVGLRTVFRWQALRVGPPSAKVGKQRLFLRDDVIAWLRSNQTGPNNTFCQARETARLEMEAA